MRLPSNIKSNFGFVGAYWNRSANIIRLDIDKGELTNKIKENEIHIVVD